MKNSFRPFNRKVDPPRCAASAAVFSPILTPIDASLLAASTILCLAGRLGARNMA
jgi:hypothetical protein